jgi:hypothetical protein
MGDVNFDNYLVARPQSFSFASMASVTFAKTHICFSSLCTRKLNTNFAELLVHPNENILIVRPCHEEHKNAMRWAYFRNGKMHGRRMGGGAYIKTLYEIFGWKNEYKYRLRGNIVRFGDILAISFYAGEYEIIASNNEAVDDKDFYIAARYKRYSVLLPSKWQNSLGVEFCKYAADQLERNLGMSFDSLEYNSQGIMPTPIGKAKENVHRLLLGTGGRLE